MLLILAIQEKLILIICGKIYFYFGLIITYLTLISHWSNFTRILWKFCFAAMVNIGVPFMKLSRGIGFIFFYVYNIGYVLIFVIILFYSYLARPCVLESYLICIQHYWELVFLSIYCLNCLYSHFYLLMTITINISSRFKKKIELWNVSSVLQA